MEIVNLRQVTGPKLIRLKVHTDERGFFKESFRKNWHTEEFVQDNISFSKKDVIRGMHFQSEPGQAKLVSVMKGKIFDVVVDIRPDSPTFGTWEGVYLDDSLQLYIPIGFAHGFCVVSDDAIVHYKVSSFYDPLTEKTFRYNDPTLNIEWPTHNPITSPRDANSPFFQELFP